jgi:hypothetical protein
MLSIILSKGRAFAEESSWLICKGVMRRGPKTKHVYPPPLAVNCWGNPRGMFGVAGVTYMAVNVADDDGCL